MEWIAVVGSLAMLALFGFIAGYIAGHIKGYNRAVGYYRSYDNESMQIIQRLREDKAFLISIIENGIDALKQIESHK